MTNDLLDVLLSMRGGQVATDISNKFDEVLKAVVESGGKGELTIKLKIAPSKFAMGGMVVEVETEHETKMKKPELAIGKSTFFVTKEGKLTRDDPAQVAMFEAAEEKNSGRTQ